MKYTGVIFSQGRRGMVCPHCGRERAKQRRWWRVIQRSVDGKWRAIVRPRSCRVQKLTKLAVLGRMVWVDMQTIARPAAMWGRNLPRDDEVTAAVAAMHRRMEENKNA